MLNPNNIKYLKCLINIITKIPYNDLNNLIAINNEILVNKKNHKNSRIDILLKVNEHFIIIEMNKNFYHGIINKNYNYLYKIGSLLYEKGEDFYNDKKLILINFDNYDYFKKNELIYKCQIKNKNSQIDNRNLEIYHINLKYLNKYCYNKDIKDLTLLERYLLMLVVIDSEKRKEIQGRDEILEKVNKTIEEFNEERFRNIFDDIDERMYDEWEKEYRYKQGVKYGKRQGRKEGILEANSNIAINLYKNKIPIDIITNSTGITKQELMKLIN